MSTRPATDVLSQDQVAAFRAEFDQARRERGAIQERLRQIGVQMRLAKCSYREMSLSLGISRSYARDLVKDPQGVARRARTRIVELRRAAAR
jgi:hypothetical protein